MLLFLNKNKVNLVLCLAELAVGILLLINPQGFTRGIIMAVGLAIAVLGVFNVIRYFRTDAMQAALESKLAYGLGQLALGLFCLVKSTWLVGLFPVLTRIYGAGALVLALYRVQQFIDVRRLRLGKGIVTGVTALMTLAYAAVILLTPEITWVFIGVALLIEALMDILILIFERKAA